MLFAITFVGPAKTDQMSTAITARATSHLESGARKARATTSPAVPAKTALAAAFSTGRSAAPKRARARRCRR